MQHGLNPFAALVFGLLLSVFAAAQAPFVNYESGQVHPIRVSADGSRLYVLNTPDARLAVFSLADPERPLLLCEIQVGLEPVSLTERTADEVWVVNNLSDTVSVVSIPERRVVATIDVPDEPADVVFARGRAFVALAASDAVSVFDVETHAALAVIAIPGKDPRALAVTADGKTVLAMVQKSGNRTTLIHEDYAPPPPPPAKDDLPPAPKQAIIISLDDPKWSWIPMNLPDIDLVAIDADALAITATVSGIGTTNFDLAVDPATGDVLVANTNANNTVDFEPELKAHAIDSRITRVRFDESGGHPEVIDLNAGIDYTERANDAAKAIALAEPTGLAVSADGTRIYVAAQGTDRIGVLDRDGKVLARIELAEAKGAVVDTERKRGPRNLVLDPSGRHLYVLNRLSHSVAIVDVESRRLVREQSIGFDPTPVAVALGRRFLYDAKLSGNGTMSCAACHIDGDHDFLSWNLGDPKGEMAPVPPQRPPFGLPGIKVAFHPMKGPMVTQTLRGLGTVFPLHWRGDRAGPDKFNPAFHSLLGGQELTKEEMALFSTFLESAEFHPNPNQNLDRTHPAGTATANADEGDRIFHEDVSVAAGPKLQLKCIDCHSQPDGSSDLILPPLLRTNPQPIKVPHIRNVYRRQGAKFDGTPSKLGFGLLHDGQSPTMRSLFDKIAFNVMEPQAKDHVTELVRAFDTGTAPAVGHQLHLDRATVTDSARLAEWETLEAQAKLENADLVAHGTIDGRHAGLAFEPAESRYVSDVAGLATMDRTELVELIAAGRAELVFTGVPPGAARRGGIDRDLDGIPDAQDGRRFIGRAGSTARGPLVLDLNREPGANPNDLALVVAAPPSSTGFIVVGTKERDGRVLGTPGVVDVEDGVHFIFPLTVGADGMAWFRPSGSKLAELKGQAVVAQAFFVDGNEGRLVATNGLAFTLVE